MAPYLFLLVAVLSWAGNYVLAGGIHEQIAPVPLAFYRWLTACVLLLPLAVPKVTAQWSLIRKHLVLLSVLGFFSVTAFNTLIYQALQVNSVINTVLINATTPIIIIFLSRWMYGGSIRLLEIGGTLFSFAGIVLILIRADIQHLLHFRLAASDCWAFAAVLSWSLYSVLLKRLPEAIHPTGAMAVMFATGFAMLLPVFGLDRIVAGRGPSMTSALWGSVVYLAVFASILGYWCWNRAIEIIGARRAGPFLHLSPIFSILGAVLLLDESFHMYHLAALIMIVSGVGIVQYSSAGKNPLLPQK
ncbi:MAG: DMT family transporter [Desulfobacteraceae bacterium]|jgi:drug/metabolite transporter (DMT)-like permease